MDVALYDSLQGGTMVINVVSESECCGCGACAAACPHGCLRMEPDGVGFLHSVLDERACTGCGLCEKVCPVLVSLGEDGVRGVFWARSRDEAQLAASSSGGVFGLLARLCLQEGGAVYGATFGGRCREVRHVRVEAPGDLDSIMRSKYVQSEVPSEVYWQVEGDLREGRRVLFSGTACQVAGMRSYLERRRIDQSNFLCVDVICHGVPSPRLWRAWLDSLAEGEGSEIDEVNFRSKSTGWLTYSLSYKHESEKVNACRFSSDWYMRAFLSNASLRPSCFRCPSKRSCESDLTLGDFWGIQSQHPEAFDDRGVSAVIANTEKGIGAFDEIEGRVEWGRSSFEKVVAGNSALATSVESFSEYDEFMSAIRAGCDVDAMRIRWSFEPSLVQRVRGKLSAVMRRVLEAF